VYKRATHACRSARVCSLYEQQPWAIELLFGGTAFSPGAPLDRPLQGAQDRSYTNDSLPTVQHVTGFAGFEDGD
jgi:hypothetical protein